MKLTEARKSPDQIAACFDKLAVDSREYMLGWLEMQYEPDSIELVMERAAVATGRAALREKTE